MRPGLPGAPLPADLAPGASGSAKVWAGGVRIPATVVRLRAQADLRLPPQARQHAHQRWKEADADVALTENAAQTCWP